MNKKRKWGEKTVWKKRAVVLAVAGVLALGGLWAAGKEPEGLTVDGAPVSQEELEFQDGDPERAVRAKVIQNWAVEEGIAEPFSYEEFQKSLEKENEERRTKKDAGETLYGPVEFTPMQYYKKQMGDYEQALQEKIKETISGQEAAGFYEEHREEYRTADTVWADYTIRQDGRILYQGEVILDAGNIRGMTETDEELAGRLLQLSEGEKTVWTGNGGEEKELICTKREEGIIPSYEEISQAVLEQCAAARFEEELEKKIKDCEVQDNRN